MSSNDLWRVAKAEIQLYSKRFVNKLLTTWPDKMSERKISLIFLN